MFIICFFIHKMKEKRDFMKQEQLFTDYDNLVQSRELQMMKSMLPFVGIKQQKPLAILIQSLQFRNAVKMFQNNENALSACSISVTNETEKRNAMIQTLRKFCTPKEKETIDTLLNIMCVMETYDAWNE